MKNNTNPASISNNCQQSPLVNGQLPIDLAQARKQLDLLGYGENEQVFLRKLTRKVTNKDQAGKKIKRKGKKKGGGISSTCTLNTLPLAQDPEWGMYFVVNGQGHLADEISVGLTLMFESDDESKSPEQHSKIWQKLGLDKPPTYQTTTRHSCHTYYVLNKPAPIGEWKELQADCNAFLGTDPRIKDAPRLMRLAGAWHVEEENIVTVDEATGEEITTVKVLPPFRCELVNVTGRKYSYEELREMIPRRQEKDKPKSQSSQQKPSQKEYLPWGSEGLQISDYVEKAKDLLGTTLYAPYLVDDHGRCDCPFHDSQSGNSSWVRGYPDGSGYHYNCPVCTDLGGRESINTFEFWLWQKYGANTPIPKGKDYAEAAREFCSLAGIEIPEFKPQGNAPSQKQPLSQEQSPKWKTRVKELIDEHSELGKRLSGILTEGFSLQDLVNSALAVTEGIADPIQELKDWMQTVLPNVDSRKSEWVLNIAGAIDAKFGNRGTRIEISKLCQDYSPQVGNRPLLTNLKDICAMLGDGSRIASPKKNLKQLAVETTARVFPNLRFNRLTGKAECNGKELRNIELAYLCPELVEDELGKDLAVDAILVNCHRNEYHPVQNYLESVRHTPQLSDETWNNLASLLLGSHDELAQIVLRKALIAAVARIYKPGCYVRMVPVLQGEQNAGKSTFLRVLAGDEFFCDSLGRLDNPKDDFQLLHSYWVHEWAEIDKLSKKSAGDIKSFITKSKDDYRAPYARAPESHPRQCVIFGTCNRRDFLKDPTGSTRFSVVEIGEINLKLLKEWRDSIWATALARYEAGETWELTRAEQALSELNNNAFSELDAWHEDVQSIIANQDKVSIPAILSELGVEIPKKNNADARRVRDVLTRLGWTQDKNPTYFGAHRTRVWHSPLANPHPDTIETPLTQSNSADCAAIVPPIVPSKSYTEKGFQPLDTIDTIEITKKTYPNSSSLSKTQADITASIPDVVQNIGSGESGGGYIGKSSVSIVSKTQKPYPVSDTPGTVDDTVVTQSRHNSELSTVSGEPTQSDTLGEDTPPPLQVDTFNVKGSKGLSLKSMTELDTTTGKSHPNPTKSERDSLMSANDLLFEDCEVAPPKWQELLVALYGVNSREELSLSDLRAWVEYCDDHWAGGTHSYQVG